MKRELKLFLFPDETIFETIKIFTKKLYDFIKMKVISVHQEHL